MTCSVEACDRDVDVKSAGLCIAHYKRQRKGKPLAGPARSREPVECCLDGCTGTVRTAHEKPLCADHAFRRRLGDFSPVRQAQGECAVPACDRPGRTRGWCRFHYQRHREGRPMEGPKRAPARRRTNKAGYVMLFMPGAPGATKGGYLLEHRHVMQQTLGRTLRSDENVHHRNGVKDDNRPSNLELWVVHQPQGQRVVDALAYAREIIERYGDAPL